MKTCLDCRKEIHQIRKRCWTCSRKHNAKSSLARRQAQRDRAKAAKAAIRQEASP